MHSYQRGRTSKGDKGSRYGVSFKQGGWWRLLCLVFLTLLLSPVLRPLFAVIGWKSRSHSSKLASESG